MSTGWLVLQWLLAALGAAVFWAIVVAFVVTAVDRWWHGHHHRGPHTRTR